LREFVVGTGGKNHTGVDADPIPNREAANDATYGALVLTLHPRSYEWQFRSEAGAAVDSGSGNCR
jgi:acid phosphatase type 7